MADRVIMSEQESHKSEVNDSEQAAFISPEVIGERLEKQEMAIDKAGEKWSGLSEQEQARLRRAQKRNFIFAIIFGLILASFGYFAGQNFRKGQTESLEYVELHTVAVSRVVEVESLIL